MPEALVDIRSRGNTLFIQILFSVKSLCKMENERCVWLDCIPLDDILTQEMKIYRGHDLLYHS